MPFKCRVKGDVVATHKARGSITIDVSDIKSISKLTQESRLAVVLASEQKCGELSIERD